MRAQRRIEFLRGRYSVEQAPPKPPAVATVPDPAPNVASAPPSPPPLSKARKGPPARLAFWRAVERSRSQASACLRERGRPASKPKRKASPTKNGQPSATEGEPSTQAGSRCRSLVALWWFAARFGRLCREREPSNRRSLSSTVASCAYPRLG